jgi:hypothetical protein
MAKNKKREDDEMFNVYSCDGECTNDAGVAYVTDGMYMNSDGDFCDEDGKVFNDDDEEE